VTKVYAPRSGSYAAKAIDVLRPLAGQMVASGTLARLVGCKTSHLPTVLAAAIESRAIVRQRTQSGNWYSLGEAAHLMRQRPATSVFDVSSPEQGAPTMSRPSRLPIVELGHVRFGRWTDGALSIERGAAMVDLSPSDVRDLKALLLGQPAEAAA